MEENAPNCMKGENTKGKTKRKSGKKSLSIRGEIEGGRDFFWRSYVWRI